MAPLPRYIGGIAPFNPLQTLIRCVNTDTHRWPRNTATSADLSHFIRNKAATLSIHRPSGGEFALALGTRTFCPLFFQSHNALHVSKCGQHVRVPRARSRPNAHEPLIPSARAELKRDVRHIFTCQRAHPPPQAGKMVYCIFRKKNATCQVRDALAWDRWHLAGPSGSPRALRFRKSRRDASGPRQERSPLSQL